jgi:hypothetical protein
MLALPQNLHLLLLLLLLLLVCCHLALDCRFLLLLQQVWRCCRRLLPAAPTPQTAEP